MSGNEAFLAKLAAEKEKRERQNAINAQALQAQAKIDVTGGHGWYGNGGSNGVATPKTDAAAKSMLAGVQVPPDWDFVKRDIPAIPEFERSDADKALDEIVRTLPITVAYRRWIPKGDPEIAYAGQVESIMISCPMPGHEDQNPSAWCNTAKNLWFCAKCTYGGDIYDLAAIRFGFPVPSYKTNGQFRQVRAAMARDFGIETVRGVNGKEYVVSGGNGLTAPSAPTAAPAVPMTPTAPKGFTLPGLKSVSASVPTGAAPVSLESIAAMVRESGESPAAPQAGVPVAPSLPVGPPVIPPTLAPPTPPVAPVPHQATAPVAEATPTRPVQIPHQVPAQPFQVPGLTPMVASAPIQNIPVLPPIGGGMTQSPSGLLVPPPGLPIALGIEVREPDAKTLESLGLSETGEVTDTGAAFTGASLNWRAVTAGGTFLDKYMSVAIEDDCPEEFHFFSALAAIGMAVGRDLRLRDRNPVHSNLNLCLLGPSGDGKSNAKRYLNQLMSQALPYDDNDMGSKGVKLVSNPASGEVMVKAFEKRMQDPTDPKITVNFAPVRGIMDFPEFALLMKRASAPNNTSAQFLMQFFDCDDDIRTASLTNGRLEAKNAFATAFSTTQPLALKNLVTEEHVSNGFLNRWIFVTGKNKKGSIAPIGEDVIDVAPLVSPLQDIWGWAGQLSLNSPLIGLPPTALKMAIDFIRDVIYPKIKADESGLITRSDLMFKKFILLFTLNLMQPAVPVQCVEWAIEMFNYISATYATLDKAVHHNVSVELRTQVIKAIVGLHKKNGRPASLKQIADRVGHRQWSDKHILECVQSLVKLGHVEELPPEVGGPGRKTVRYQITASGE